jgi:hypothetical protein
VLRSGVYDITTSDKKVVGDFDVFLRRFTFVNIGHQIGDRDHACITRLQNG